LEFIASRGSTSTTSQASPYALLTGKRNAAYAAMLSARAVLASKTSRYACHLGHAGNGDAMLAYHLMDFSRYFFDQSDIRH